MCGLMKCLPALALGAAGVLSMATTALAVPITYTEQATASGSLGGVSFTNASVTLTMSNDTTNVTGTAPIFVNLGTVTLDVTGFAPATFTDSTQVDVNQSSVLPNVQSAGFADITENLAILVTEGSAFATYDLTTAIGPIAGTADLNSGFSFPTTDGAFILNSVSGNADFTASTSTPPPSVPEPGSLMLLCTGLAGIGLMIRRDGLTNRKT
jgi:hypothetical protein